MVKKASLKENILVALLSIVLGFIVGAVVMVFFGYNPLQAYRAMIGGVMTNAYFFGEALSTASILALVGIAFSIASTAGFFNIGLSGQFLMGWLSSMVVALSFPQLNSFLLVSLCLLAGILAGGLWAAIAGALRAYRGSSEVIVTIMLNYVALHLTNYYIADIYGSTSSTASVLDQASLRVNGLTQLFGGSRVNLGLFFLIAIMLLHLFVMKRTTFGYEIKASGLNPLAAEYAGMDTKKNIVLSMAISGGIAGLAGVVNALGVFGNIFIQSALPQEGFNGIAVALLGMNHPLGILLSSLLFSILQTGSRFMPNAAGVPDELAQLVIAAIIFFIGVNYIIRYGLNKLKGGRSE